MEKSIQKNKKNHPIELDTSEYILLALSDQKETLYASCLYCKHGVFRYPNVVIDANCDKPIVILNIDSPSIGEDITECGYKILGSNSLELFGTRLYHIPTYIMNCGKEELNVASACNRFYLPNDGKMYRIKVYVTGGKEFT